MIKNSEMLRRFEDEFARKEGPLPFSQAARIFEAMWKEGERMGVLPAGDPLEGIEVDIRIARILNSCLKSSFQK